MVNKPVRRSRLAEAFLGTLRTKGPLSMDSLSPDGLSHGMALAAALGTTHGAAPGAAAEGAAAYGAPADDGPGGRATPAGGGAEEALERCCLGEKRATGRFWRRACLQRSGAVKRVKPWPC